MDFSKKGTKITWADCNKDMVTPKLTNKEDVSHEFERKKYEFINGIHNPITNFDEENQKMETRINTIQISKKTPKIVENVTSEYVKKTIYYSNTNKLLYKKEEPKKFQHKQPKKKKKNGKCYTCFPERKVLKHIIKPNIDENVIFHHDMWNRNMIIVTPKKHYRNIEDFPEGELTIFFTTIKKFCNQWNLDDYSLTFNHGEWKSHDHFHVKIKILEKVANRLRGDHFRLLKRFKEYETSNEI
jgi:hypothetical protein